MAHPISTTFAQAKPTSYSAPPFLELVAPLKDPRLALQFHNFICDQGALSFEKPMHKSSKAYFFASKLALNSPLAGGKQVGKEVVIKVIERDFARTAPQSYRLKKTHLASESLPLRFQSSPHLITTYSLITYNEVTKTFAVRSGDLSEVDNEWILGVVMERVEGVECELIEKNCMNQLDLLRNCTKSALLALDTLHSQGILHRNVKPDTLLLTENGEVRLIEYYLARDLKDSSPMTYSGTPEYIAPELFGSGKFSEKTDLFSLGATVYVVAFRDKPFSLSGEETDKEYIGNVRTVAKNFQSKKVTSLREFHNGKGVDYSDCAADKNDIFWSFMEDVLAINPTKRPSAAQALAHPFITGKNSPLPGKVISPSPVDLRIGKQIRNPQLARRFEDFLKKEGVLALGASLGEGASAVVVSANIAPSSTLFGGFPPKKEVALKLVRSDYARDCAPDSYLFTKDRKAAESLALRFPDSPHLIRTYSLITYSSSKDQFAVRFGDVSQLEGEQIFAVVMEKVEGLRGHLGEIDLRNRAIAIKKAATDILKGLSLLHERKIIHRDIKPENVLVAKAFILTDYGLARDLGATPKGRARTSCGTPEYYSPEVHRGLKYDEKADIFSVGATVYEAAFGVEPFSTTGKENRMFYASRYEDYLDGSETTFEEFHRSKKRDFSESCMEKDPMFWSFLNPLLAKRPEERLSANEALSHPFLQ